MSTTEVKCSFSSKDGVLRSVIVTKRMVLRSFEPRNLELYKKHTKLVASVYCDPKIMKFVERHRPYGKKDLIKLVTTWTHTWAQGSPASAWIAYQRPARVGTLEKYLNPKAKFGKFIGVFMLDPGDAPGSVELGYVLDSPHWKKGYGYEGAHALVYPVVKEINAKRKKFGFDRIREVFATSSVGNAGSIKILDALKFKAYPKKNFAKTIRLKKVTKNSKPRSLGVRKGIPKYFFFLRISK